MKKNKLDNRQLYTSSETTKLLNISPSTLRNLVEKGLIEKVVPIGYQHGYYTKESVEDYLREKELFEEKYSPIKEKHAIFKKATKEDIPTCLKLGVESYPNYPQEPASIETRLKWLDKNPDLFYVIKHKDEVVGYTGIIPMTQEKIMRILGNKDTFKDIKSEEIEKFEAGNIYNIYINTMRTKANISRLEKRTYGMRLIEGLITIILEMVERGISFDTLYARSETVDGIRLLKHLNFKEIPSTTHYKNFALKVDNKTIQALQKYQQAKEKRKAH